MLQIGAKKFFAIKNVKITVPQTYCMIDLNGEETFYENNCKI